jgi:hypothetical protein
MTYTNLQLIRKLIADPYRYAFDTQEGDGETLKFQLSHKPVKDGSYTVYVNDTEQDDTGDTPDYEIDLEKGIVTFTAAPASEASIEMEYDYSVFSDDEITEFLAQNNDNVNATIKMMIEILIADTSRRFDYENGQTKMKPDQVFQHLKDLLKIYSDKADSSPKGAQYVERINQFYEDTTEETADLTRDDLGL